MLNVGKSYIKVWETEDKGKYVTGKVSSSRKDKQNEGQYINSNWFCRFVGQCVGLAKTLAKGDRITVLNGTVESVYDKEKGKTYTTLVIFEFEQGVVNTNTGGGFTEIETDDELPF